MDCYKEMYIKLFNKVTDVINDLQAIQKETEELFLVQEQEKEVRQIFVQIKSGD